MQILVLSEIKTILILDFERSEESIDFIMLLILYQFTFFRIWGRRIQEF